MILYHCIQFKYIFIVDIVDFEEDLAEKIEKNDKLIKIKLINFFLIIQFRLSKIFSFGN